MIDRVRDPVLVTVTVTGTNEPSDPDVLASLIAESLGRAVDVEVVWVPVLPGSAPAP